jgi:hypothetical protein
MLRKVAWVGLPLAWLAMGCEPSQEIPKGASLTNPVGTPSAGTGGGSTTNSPIADQNAAAAQEVGRQMQQRGN